MIVLFALFLCLGMFTGLASICAYITAHCLYEVISESTLKEVERTTMFVMTISIFFMILTNIVATIM